MGWRGIVWLPGSITNDLRKGSAGTLSIVPIIFTKDHPLIWRNLCSSARRVDHVDLWSDREKWLSGHLPHSYGSQHYLLEAPFWSKWSVVIVRYRICCLVIALTLKFNIIDVLFPFVIFLLDQSCHLIYFYRKFVQLIIIVQALYKVMYSLYHITPDDGYKRGKDIIVRGCVPIDYPYLKMPDAKPSWHYRPFLFQCKLKPRGITTSLMYGWEENSHFSGAHGVLPKQN